MVTPKEHSMTETAVVIPDYVTVKRSHSIRDLAEVVASLLDEAKDLGFPRRIELWPGEIEAAFDRDPETFRVLAQWAERFGGTVTGEPTEGSDGRPLVRAEVRFVYQAVDVRAYAYVRNDT
jgi:hypothetical protein